MKLNAARSNNQGQESRDASIQKIAQVYLPDARKDFSPKYLKRKKIINIAGYSILSLLVFCLAVFIFSSNRVEVAINITKLAKNSQESRQKEIINEYKFKLNLLDPSVSAGYLNSACSPLSKVERDRVFVVTKQSGATAIATLNFNKPVDFSSGYFMLDTRSLSEAGSVKMVLKDENSVSNAKQAKPFVVDKSGWKSKSIVVKPSVENPAMKLNKISQVRFEVSPLSPTQKAQTSVLIEKFSFLTQTQISED